MNSIPPPSYSPPPSPRPTSPIVWALAIFGALALAFAVLIPVVLLMTVGSFSNLALSGGVGSGAISGTGETHYLPTTTTRFLAAVKLHSAIDSAVGAQVIEKLQEAVQNESAVAILMDINSPGGTVVASQEMYDAIVAAKKVKPVVCHVRDMAASGAYYTASACSHITASRGSLIGSIGVIMSGLETSKLLEFMKIKPVTLKTGKLKDSGSETREWTAEDTTYLQKIINDTKEQFMADVVAERKLDEAAQKYMSDARVVLGTEAVQLKLIDSLGSWDDSKETAVKLSKTSMSSRELKVIYMEDKPTLLEELGLHSTAHKIGREAGQGLKEGLMAMPQSPLPAAR